MSRPRALGALLALALAIASCSSSSDEDPAAFCEALRAASAPNGSVGSVDLDDSASVEAATTELSELAELAPAEIADDLTVVRDVYADVLSALATTAPGVRDDILRDLQPRLDEATGPAAAVEAYASTTCGLEFEGPAQPTPTPTPLDVQD